MPLWRADEAASTVLPLSLPARQQATNPSHADGDPEERGKYLLNICAFYRSRPRRSLRPGRVDLAIKLAVSAIHQGYRRCQNSCQKEGDSVVKVIWYLSRRFTYSSLLRGNIWPWTASSILQASMWTRFFGIVWDWYHYLGRVYLLERYDVSCHVIVICPCCSGHVHGTGTNFQLINSKSTVFECECVLIRVWNSTACRSTSAEVRTGKGPTKERIILEQRQIRWNHHTSTGLNFLSSLRC